MDLSIPPQLPISAKAEEIGALIQAHPVVVVAGETGSGKSTQLAKICLRHGRGESGLIGHTQPRRIAARSISARLAQELKVPLGGFVGCQIRFMDKTSAETKVKVMTDGILLQALARDRDLRQYDTLIIDEAHERSLNIDFILGYLKKILKKRRDLKVVITSATLDHQRFSQFFADAPLVSVSGRSYPVEIQYCPLIDQAEQSLEQVIAQLIEQTHPQRRGDVLVFLSGVAQIHALKHQLKPYLDAQTDILPLYSRLSMAEQQKIFNNNHRRKIILATNVAETALTIPNIDTVIDLGQARISRYHPGRKITYLPIEPIARANANQRSGRCGRVGPGVCYRLYSEQDFLNRPEFPLPEILRSDLSTVILQMLAMGLGCPEQFDFINQPSGAAIKDGYLLLKELGAIDVQHQLTPLGQQMATFPIPPRFSRILLRASQLGCLNDCLIIVSGLSVPDPRERPPEKTQMADERHRIFLDKQSDFLSLLNLFNQFVTEQQQLTKRQLSQWAKQHFLSLIRLQQWQEIVQQLTQICRQHQLRVNQQAGDYAQIHRALLSGFFMLTGQKIDNKQYQMTRARQLAIFPGSGLAKTRPLWIMAADLMHTQQLYAHCCAAIEPSWLIEAGQYALRYAYDEPHFSKKRQQVVAKERIILYGLVLSVDNWVHYGPIDSPEAWQLFIRQGLVEQQCITNCGFYQHNNQLLAQGDYLEAQARRRDIVIDEQQLVDFYQQQLPESIYNTPLLNQYYQRCTKQQQQQFYFDPRSVLSNPQTDLPHEVAYPHVWCCDKGEFALHYVFAPGQDDDGVSVLLDKKQQFLIRQIDWDWLVPGYLLEKITQLLKTLPKAKRRSLMPLSHFSQACYQRLIDSARQTSLCQALAVVIGQMTGLCLRASDFSPERLPVHLQMRFCLCDDQGEIVAVFRDGQLSNEKKIPQPVIDTEQSVVQPSQSWTFNDILPYHNHRYFGLKKITAGIIVADHDSAYLAEQAHRLALSWLFVYQCSTLAKAIKKNFTDYKKYALYYAPLGELEQLIEQLALSVVYWHYLSGQTLIYDQVNFNHWLEQHQANWVADVSAQFVWLKQLINAWHGLRTQLNDCPERLAVLIKTELNDLLTGDYLLTTPPTWQKRLPVYLKAMQTRIDKANLQGEKLISNQPWQQYRIQLTQARDKQPIIQQIDYDNAVIQFQFMIEEYRLACFAQPIKTVIKVSEKRIKQQWRLLQAVC